MKLINILRQPLHEIREDNELLRGRKSTLGELFELIREFKHGASLG